MILGERRWISKYKKRNGPAGNSMKCFVEEVQRYMQCSPEGVELLVVSMVAMIYTLSRCIRTHPRGLAAVKPLQKPERKSNNFAPATEADECVQWAKQGHLLPPREEGSTSFWESCMCTAFHREQAREVQPKLWFWDGLTPVGVSNTVGCYAELSIAYASWR